MTKIKTCLFKNVKRITFHNLQIMYIQVENYENCKLININQFTFIIILCTII